MRQLPFLDSDHEIEVYLGCSIREFFDREGEAAFREVEERVIRETLADPQQRVIATGGDDPLLGIGERLADHALLDFAKCRLAFAIEELTDRAAEIDLDLVVGVQKRQLAHARQLSPDRGFSTTGHAYKDDQGQVLGRAPAEMVNGTVVFRPSGDVKLIVPVPDVAVAPNL